MERGIASIACRFSSRRGLHESRICGQEGVLHEKFHSRVFPAIQRVFNGIEVSAMSQRFA